MPLNTSPRGIQQNYHCEPSAYQVLLMPHALIGGYQNVVALMFSRIEQVSIGERFPSLFHCRIY